MNIVARVVTAIIATVLTAAAAVGNAGTTGSGLVAGTQPDTIIVALPASADPHSVESATTLLNTIFDQAEPNSNVLVLDGEKGRRLAHVVIPETRNKTARERAIARALGGVGEFLTAERSTSSANQSVVNVPEIASVVSNLVGMNGDETRLVIIGSPFSSVGDHRFRWREGQVLSDAHIAAVPRLSIWGTAGRAGDLRGVRVDFVCTNPSGNSSTRQPVKRFYENYFSSIGGELVTFSTDAVSAASNALAGASGRDAAPGLDAWDDELKIWNIVDRSPPPVESQTPTIAAYFMIDGTPSMSAHHEPFRRAGYEAIELMARSAPETTLGISVFSEAGTFTTMPMASIGSSSLSAPAAGLAEVSRFLNTEAFAGTGSVADVEGVLMEAIAQLSRTDASRVVLFWVADTGPFEMDREFGMSAADAAAEERCKARLAEFVRMYPDTRIVVAYLGDEGEEIGRRSLGFFDDLVDVAGGHSTVTRSLDNIEPLLSRAVLAD